MQPIRDDLADMVRSWLVDKSADERVFEKLPNATAPMIRSDLAAARSAWIDDAGQDEQERSRREASDFLRYRDGSGRCEALRRAGGTIEKRGWPQTVQTVGNNRVKRRHTTPCDGVRQEAPVGFEPTMADLQSAALATWPRRQA